MHDEHMESGKYIHETLGVDEVWYLFSLNWQKDAASYASLDHRMAMARIMTAHYKDHPFVLTDIEDRLGTHITAELLPKIQAERPDDRFIWVMGADNLLTFKTWDRYETIIENFPIAVMRREPYTDAAMKSFAALTYAHMRLEKPEDLLSAPVGWALMDNRPSDMSSSELKARIRVGGRDFSPAFQEVVDYIHAHGLYGTGAPKAPAPDTVPGLTL